MFEALFEIIKHRYFLIGTGGLFTASLCGNCILDVKDDLNSDFVEDNNLEERSYRSVYVEAEEEVKTGDDKDHFLEIGHPSTWTNGDEIKVISTGDLEELVIEEIDDGNCLADSSDVKAPEIIGLKVIKKGDNAYYYGRVSDEGSGLSYASVSVFKRDTLQASYMDDLNGINEFELDESYLREVEFGDYRSYKINIGLRDCSRNTRNYSVKCKGEGYCKVLE